MTEKEINEITISQKEDNELKKEEEKKKEEESAFWTFLTDVGSKTLGIIDFIGEKVCDFVGLTDSKYQQWVYYKEEEEEERERKLFEEQMKINQQLEEIENPKIIQNGNEKVQEKEKELSSEDSEQIEFNNKIEIKPQLPTEEEI
ncbi:hypothetical protein M0812_06709 [Anaeramoeba flamelloides]|uniref:Uncharacterized protein n=1 Tax=Anaeramoeba flamelloides TaxID=1746091 RepID=A0AAV8A8C1_9EUKA|nr:hypothetical protein M0812_06709 [Anaeramoeba flamelloides]